MEAALRFQTAPGGGLYGAVWLRIAVVGGRRVLVELNDLFLPRPLVIFERQAHDLSLLEISQVDRLAAVAEMGHGFAQRHAEGLGALRPGVTVAVQADVLEAKPIGALAEAGGAHFVVLLRELWK